MGIIHVNGSTEETNYSPTVALEKSVQASVQAASAEVNTEPTPAQIEGGNYKKGHVTIGDFDITIENPVGSIRKGVDANGNAWETTMANAYGYIKGTESVDGDHIDVFLAEDMDWWDGRRVFVLDQTKEDGSFDEHKVMLGFNDGYDAMKATLPTTTLPGRRSIPDYIFQKSTSRISTNGFSQATARPSHLQIFYRQQESPSKNRQDLTTRSGELLAPTSTGRAKLRQISDKLNTFVTKYSGVKNIGEQHEYFPRYMQPLLQEIGRIAGANKRKRRELTDYIMAKHGLERNEYIPDEAIRALSENMTSLLRAMAAQKRLIHSIVFLDCWNLLHGNGAEYD